MGRAGKRVRSTAHEMVRRLGRTLARRVPAPERVAVKLVKWSVDPCTVGAAVVREVEADLPIDVVAFMARYLRGDVLMGDGDRLEWRHTPQRAVVTVDVAHVPTRVKTYSRRAGWTVHFDRDHEAIIRACVVDRPDSWLTPRLIEVYLGFARQGFIRCAATYVDGKLAGGHFGFTVGSTYALMSMFHTVDHAGSVAMAATLAELEPAGRWTMIDVGELKPSFERFGAYALPIAEFNARVLGQVTGGASHPANLEGDAHGV